ncbi:B-cell receptor CD22-like isoform X2 [Antennarius striatus]|uniref:B-cell receptor CD22-like isoform X2 n=1 Tax=Antennarius striatus TaxID=241820 RepID=UPI0035B359C7
MEMDAHRVVWFCCVVFLVLNKNFSDCHNPFELTESHLTVMAGSCVELKCRLTGSMDNTDAYWFWMTKFNWNWREQQYVATIVYSSNNSLRPVSPNFANRVRYTGSPSSSWRYNTRSERFFSIEICDLRTTDSGSYAFRFIRTKKLSWSTGNLVLTVTENPCPITFEKPSDAKESDMVTLSCSTLSSCPNKPKITCLPQSCGSLPQNAQTDGTRKTTAVTFQANWDDDGKEFWCQTENNRDVHLIRRIIVNVEYAPKDTAARIISRWMIAEGQDVRLTCSAKGRPDPIFTWTKNESILAYGADWLIPSITDSQSGKYLCEAHNNHGSAKSQPLDIVVKYAPQVEVKMISSGVTQGDEMTLQCVVKRSDPMPHKYGWLRNQRRIGVDSLSYIKTLEPEDSGAYTCSATNTVGPGTSKPLQVQVQYGPRQTHVFFHKKDKKVKINESLTLSCETDASPEVESYSWSRYEGNKDTNSSKWKSYISDRSYLYIPRVQRTDEACYVCKATNIIRTGENSEPMCIQVLYPPTNLVLSMDAEVTAGQLATISCTVESAPPSRLQLIKTSTSNPPAPEWRHAPPDDGEQINALVFKFTVDRTHAGVYSCEATNSIDSNRSTQRKLVVKYPPQDVRVRVWPGLIVDEKQSLSLQCSAQSHPAVSSFTWMVVTDGRSRTIQKTQTVNIMSTGPSDSGLYVCSASNEVGTGRSEQIEVKVKYAPKEASITRSEEQQHPDGMRSVMLSCSSRSFPAIRRYAWYKKVEGEQRDVKVSDEQNYTVDSDLPGVYYCAAENEINGTLSDPVRMFDDRGFMKHLKFIFIFLVILSVIVFFFLVYRHKRNKSLQQGTTNTPTCFAFLGVWHCSTICSSSSRAALRNESPTAEPSRSRDDLLPDQPSCPKTQRRQNHPDSMKRKNTGNTRTSKRPKLQTHRTMKTR